MALLRFLWRIGKHFNARGYIYIWANLAWVLLTALVIPAPAAWAGLVYMSHKAQTQPQATMDDFWDGFKANFKRGLLVGVVTALVIFINANNLWAYRLQADLGTRVMSVVWSFAIFLCISVNMVLWPLLLEMEKPSLLTATKNALLLLARHPFFMVGIWLMALAIVVLSSVLAAAWLLITGSMLATLCTGAVLDRLKADGHHNPNHNLPEDAREFTA
jgi:uncharacterized membrane protein YesL